MSNDAAQPDIDVERYELSEGRRYSFELERRDFIRYFGGGLLVLVTAGDLLAQESGRGGGRRGENMPADVSAWLHIDAQGRVTAYTGKAEIGQNIRTSLSQAIADELRVPLHTVTLVMGDTGRTPFDMGTFGSRTTPQMAPQLARAAAAARQMLIEQAATKLQADSKTLTHGEALTGTISADAPVDPATAWKIRGTGAKKVDGRDFVTGRHQYSPDVTRPGMVYGRIIRPEAYGATLQSVDDGRARAMPGVNVVRDGDFLAVVAPTERDAECPGEPGLVRDAVRSPSQERRRRRSPRVSERRRHARDERREQTVCRHLPHPVHRARPPRATRRRRRMD
jgi:CO/xanthine dehydrogenase Mo-binding subunit